MKTRILALATLGFVLFSLVPAGYELSRRGDIPATRSFELVHNYYTDFNFYLSRIREGYEGRWTVAERYTTEPHAGSLIQWFYLGIGHVARVIPHGPFAVPAAYHMARAVLGLTLVALIAWWTSQQFTRAPFAVLAFFTVMTASSYPIVVTVGDSWRFGGYMPWWTVMDSLQRITFLPHLVAAQSLLLFLLATGCSEEVMKRPGNWIFLGFLGLVLGMILPPALIFVIAGYGFSILFEAVRDRNQLREPSGRLPWVMSHVAGRAVIGLIAAPSMLYFSLMFSIYPWKRLVEFDAQNPIVFRIPEYLKALGMTLPLGVAGLVWAAVRRDRSMKTAGVWVVTWAFLLWAFQYVPLQSPLRFTQMMPHVPLGVGTVYLFVRLWDLATGALKGKRSRMPAPVRDIALTALVVGFLVPVTLGSITMYSMWLWQKDFIDQKIRAGWPAIPMNNYIVYPARGFTDAVQFIADSTPPSAIILSDMTAGNYIPAMTGRRVYVGHENTVDKDNKLAEARFFFSGKMTIDQAVSFLRTRGIGYVFFGPQERETGGVTDISREYPFLVEIDRTADAVVYQVP